MEKPFWPACERNRDPILKRLEQILPPDGLRILEIGSGTGQHADHFTAAKPGWHWQCTDQQEYLAGIGLWQADAQRSNFPPPIELDVRDSAHWQALPATWDWVYCANALHIMHWETVVEFFQRLAPLMQHASGLLIYGPFNREGRFTSASNAEFDASLKERDPQMGIRDLESVAELAKSIGLALQATHPMPANNFLLEFRRADATPVSPG